MVPEASRQTGEVADTNPHQTIFDEQPGGCASARRKGFGTSDRLWTWISCEFYLADSETAVLLLGGDKSTQRQDIERARILVHELTQEPTDE